MKTSWLSTAIITASLALSLQAGPAQADKLPVIDFSLVLNPSVVPCLAADPHHQPEARATVIRDVAAGPNDVMLLELRNFKPGLAFDLFTVEHSRFLANGAPDLNFNGFGLSWYQSDIQVEDNGRATTVIKTILLDQIFGFIDSKTDPNKLPPTNTFHVGFWFNDPNDAAACGFDVTKPTFFNGGHRAGPLAMITLPDPQTNLGPLCTDPDPNSPSGCNP